MLSYIKRYGLRHCDLPTIIWNVGVMLKVLTLNIDSRNKKPVPWAFYLLYLVFALSYFYVYLVSMIWFVFVWCPSNDDLLAAIIVFSLGISSEIGTVKLLYMILHINKVREIVKETIARDASVVSGSRFSKNLLITLRDVKKRAIIFWVVIISNGIVYIVKPILLPGRHLTEDKFVLYGLEPMLETPNYQIAFLMMSAGTIHTVYLPANITAFLIIIAGYVEAQMLALTEELLHLWEDAEEHYYITKPVTVTCSNESQSAAKQEIINDFIADRLKYITRTHAENINLLEGIQHVFGGAIVLEFFLLMIGLIAELLGGLENTYIEIPFAMMQVGMDCYVGQKVIDASIKFERAIYDCKWENYNNTNMKIVQIMLQSSQKTMKLSAGGVIMLSFTCFMQVNRSIYSAYTTLRTIMK